MEKITIIQGGIKMGEGSCGKGPDRHLIGPPIPSGKRGN